MFSASDVEKIYSMWETKFNMYKVPDIKSENHVGKESVSDCYYYNGYILRLDYWNNMYIIESADSLENAKLNDYEDGYTYDSRYPVSEYLDEMAEDIRSDFGNEE